MTDKLNIKKADKYRQALVDFMNDHRYNDESGEPSTHRSYGTILQGTFTLQKSLAKHFVQLYCDAIENGVKDLSILEVQKEYSPIIVDIDLRLPMDDYQPGQRLYNEELVLNIMQKYIEAINTYLEVPKKDFKICLFEKERAVESDEVLKDGFHIIFPDICAHSKIRHLIRHKVVKMCDEDSMFETYIEGPDKIIDKAVVSANSWFLYGSKKPGGQLYQLTKIYNMDLDLTYDHLNGIEYDKYGNENEGKYADSELVKLFSIHYKRRRYHKKMATPLNEEFADSDIDAEFSKLGIDTTVKNHTDNKYEINDAKEDVIRKACKFTSMLSDDRANNYEEWRNVGLALHNTDDSLLSVWIEFSSKAPSKFKRAKDGQGDCAKFWKQFKTPTSGNLLTIRSLAFWAKEDSPKEYDAFMKEEFKNCLKKSLDKSTYSLAKALYTKYSDRFVCSSAKNNIWWEFKDHRWHRIEDAYSLKKLLSEDFANEYSKEIADLAIKITKMSGMEKEETQHKITRLSGITEKLLNINHKKNIIEDAKSLFFDNKFTEKLDSNIYLIGFENGIYDLEQNIFRDGRPDDFVHYSTGYSYRKYSEKMPFKANIDKFFEQIIPNEKVREYFKVALSTCVSGETKEEKLYILTGTGSNGKSLTVDLIIQALGDYYMSCPIQMITRKRGQSNETAPEKVRMRGKRFGCFQETDDGEKLNVGIMKEFTGGDKVLVRDLFKGSEDMIEYKPQMKYFLTCNQLPAVPSNDDGTWRRLRVVDFSSKFTETPTKPNEYKMNKNLKEEIKQWGPTFMSYMIHIYQTNYRGKSLVEPDEVMTSTKQYKMENDFYTEYVMEKLVITENPKDIITRDSLWENFKSWYKTNYDGRPLPKRPDFIKVMSKTLGEPAKNGFTKLLFNIVVSDDTQNNDLDI
jgi:P4 family phage/plasmid primase-like protien